MKTASTDSNISLLIFQEGCSSVWALQWATSRLYMNLNR